MARLRLNRIVAAGLPDLTRDQSTVDTSVWPDFLRNDYGIVRQNSTPRSHDSFLASRFSGAGQRPDRAPTSAHRARISIRGLRLAHHQDSERSPGYVFKLNHNKPGLIPLAMWGGRAGNVRNHAPQGSIGRSPGWCGPRCYAEQAEGTDYAVTSCTADQVAPAEYPGGRLGSIRAAPGKSIPSLRIGKVRPPPPSPPKKSEGDQMDVRQFVKRKKAPEQLTSAPIKNTKAAKRKRRQQSWIAGFGGQKALDELNKPTQEPVNPPPTPRPPVHPGARPNSLSRKQIAARRAEINAEYRAKHGKEPPNSMKIPPWHLRTSREHD